MTQLMRRFRGDESGATAIEYSLIAAFISLSVVFGARMIGSELQAIFTNVEGGFKGDATE